MYASRDRNFAKFQNREDTKLRTPARVNVCFLFLAEHFCRRCPLFFFFFIRVVAKFKNMSGREGRRNFQRVVQRGARPRAVSAFDAIWSMHQRRVNRGPGCYATYCTNERGISKVDAPTSHGAASTQRIEKSPLIAGDIGSIVISYM